MTTRMRKYRKELCFLGTCKRPQDRKRFLSQAPVGVVHGVGDIAKTLLYGNLHIAKRHRRYLKSKQSVLKKLANKRLGVGSKKKILASQVGGNILGTIWNVIKEIF